MVWSGAAARAGGGGAAGGRLPGRDPGPILTAALRSPRGGYGTAGITRLTVAPAPSTGDASRTRPHPDGGLSRGGGRGVSVCLTVSILEAVVGRGNASWNVTHSQAETCRDGEGPELLGRGSGFGGGGGGGGEKKTNKNTRAHTHPAARVACSQRRDLPAVCNNNTRPPPHFQRTM